MKVLRGVMVGVLAVVALMTAMAGAGYAWLQTDGGRRWLVAAIEEAASGSGTRLSIGGLQGRVPFALALTDLRVADAQGVWISLDRVFLKLDPVALLARRVAIDALEAGRVTVARLPETGPEPQPPPDRSAGVVPDLPVTIALGRLAVDRLELGAPVAGGRPAVLTVSGAGRLGRGAESLEATLEATRIDDRPGRAAVRLAVDPDADRFDLKAVLSEPAGGMVAESLGLPGQPPVALTLDGEGSLTRWRGHLDIKAGDGEAGAKTEVSADATVQSAGGGTVVRLDGGGSVAALVPAEVAPLLDGRSTFAGEARIEPDGRVEVRPFRLDTAAGSLTLSGIVGWRENRMALGFEVTAGATSTLKALTGGVDWQGLHLTGTAQGPVLAPTISATLTADRPAVADLTAGQVVAAVRAVPSGPVTGPGTGDDVRLGVDADVTVQDLAGADPVIAGLAGSPLRLGVVGTIQPDSGEIRIASLGVGTAAGTLVAEGVLTHWGDGVDARVRLVLDDLGRLSDLAGRPLAGSATLGAEIVRPRDGGPVRADVRGSLLEPRTGDPTADALLQGETMVVGQVTAAPAGGITLSGWRVSAPNVVLTGQGAFAAGRLDAEGRVELPVLDILAMAPLQGSLAADWAARGPLDQWEATVRATGNPLVMAGRPLGKVSLEASATNLPGAPQGTVRARAELPTGPGLSVSGDYHLNGQRLELRDLALASGPNRVTGAAQVALDTLTATGKFTGDLNELAALSPLAGAPLRGRATATLVLEAREGRQDATLAAIVRDVTVAGGDTPLLAAGRLDLNAAVADALGRPTAKATLSLSDGQAAGIDLGRVTGQVDGSLEKAAFQASLAGAVRPAATGVTVAGRPAGQPLVLEVAGTYGQDGGTRRIRLDRAEGRFAGEPFRLTGPATVESGDRGSGVAGLEIQFSRGRLALDARAGRSELTGQARLAGVPLELVALVDPTLRLRGTLDAEATLAGTPANPRADATVRLDDVQVPQAAEAGFAGVDATLEAQWRGKRLSVTGTAQTGRDGINLRGQADLPLVLDPATLTPRLPDRAPIAASLTGGVPLARFNDLLATSGDRVRGQMDLDLTLAGSLDDPRLGGSVTVADGRYESQAAGTVISDINARLTGAGESLTIERFTGSTPDGGTVEVAGRVVLTPWVRDQIDLRLNARNARLLQIDLVTATMDADLEMDGTFRESRLEGRVNVRRAEIRIPDRMPPTVVDLNVTEVGGEAGRPGAGPRVIRVPVPGRKPQPAASQPAGAARPAPPVAGGAGGSGPEVVLDLRVVADNQVFLRGRGLEAELGGELTVTGTADTPQLVGDLTMRRGQLDLLGKRFEFRRGVLQFDGGTTIDPALDLEAQANATNLTAEVRITGRASAPKLELTSNPSLPKDEVLARLLFDKPVNRLGAFEAVQLAQSAAQLVGFGAGAGLLDRVRESIGVDRLEISGGGAGGLGVPGGAPGGAPGGSLPGTTGLGGLSSRGSAASTLAQGGEATATGSGPSVSAGRYLSNDVYVGVQQGLTAGSSRAKVQVDITDNVQAEADVGTNADTRFGLRFEWDY